jgi:transcriptional regulator GlxA family with amidase domain
VRALAAHLGSSERTLRRWFDEAVGLSPRTSLALSRVRKAVELLHHGEVDGAMLAARSGHCDQSHLIRDFRRFLQTTPERWRTSLRRTRPLLRPFVDLIVPGFAV